MYDFGTIHACWGDCCSYVADVTRLDSCSITIKMVTVFQVLAKEYVRQFNQQKSWLLSVFWGEKSRKDFFFFKKKLLQLEPILAASHLHYWCCCRHCFGLAKYGKTTWILKTELSL